MPDIGATLREARVSARIDISEIETATKIRAKYLRALENEEWDLLPGPTFVKTFLRTYAEALGLDAKLLVEEYKLRHERLADSELRPIAPPRRAASSGRGGSRVLGRPSGRGGGPRSRLPLVLVLLGLVVALVVVLGLIQPRKRDAVTPAPSPTTSTSTAAQPSSGTAPTSSPKRRRTRRTVATLRILPTADVDVCLKAGSKTHVNGVTLRKGDVAQTFRAKRFTLGLANTSVRLRVNGKTHGVPSSSKPVAFTITRTGLRALPATRRPVCTP